MATADKLTPAKSPKDQLREAMQAQRTKAAAEDLPELEKLLELTEDPALAGLIARAKALQVSLLIDATSTGLQLKPQVENLAASALNVQVVVKALIEEAKAAIAAAE